MTAAVQVHTQIARLLADVGDEAADRLDRLIPLVYEQLREMAHRQLGGEFGARTLQTTALVHEAYLKVAASNKVTDRGKSYFFAAAARAMRQVLVDLARRRKAGKRGGDVEVVTLDEQSWAVDAFAADVLDLDKALEKLADLNLRHARVVEYRFFGGLTVEETAAALEVSPRTVKQDWLLARAWLYEALHDRNER
jgi:RNA polymerase sigma factor (TIGR02999 family)